MANDLIHVGCKIEMRAENRPRLTEGVPEVYISQFVQWEKENVVSIVVPTYKGHSVPLTIDEIYELHFLAKSGLYRCRGKIISRGKVGNIATAVVKFISDLEKVQRRQYYRMSCLMPMYYAVLDDSYKQLYIEKKKGLSLEQKKDIASKLANQEFIFQKAIVLDISGGGLRFNSKTQQKAGDVYLLQPELPEALRRKIPYLLGRIVSSKLLSEVPLLYDNRVSFVGLTNSEREEIITYIFKEERNKQKV